MTQHEVKHTWRWIRNPFSKTLVVSLFVWDAKRRCCPLNGSQLKICIQSQDLIMFCRMWRQCVRTSEQLSELFLLPFSVPHLGLFVFMTHPHLNQNVHLFIWVHLNCLQRRHHHASHHVLVLSPSFFHSSEKKPKFCPIIHYFSYTSGLNKDAE